MRRSGGLVLYPGNRAVDGIVASVAEIRNNETHALTVEAVQWGIAELSRHRVHPYFLAYLQLRRRAKIEPEGQIDARWSDLGPLLEIPGGPARRPNYRPLWTSIERPAKYWLNGNLAGSFAPKSIRSAASFLLDGDHFALPSDHAQLAYETFLFQNRIPAMAMGAYFLRNFGFRAPRDLRPDDVIDGFRNWFKFDEESDDEFHLLFDSEVPPAGPETMIHWTVPTGGFEWFEPWREEEGDANV